MNSSLSSNICDQNVSFFTKILCRSEMKATRSPVETAKYVIKAKLVSSLRDTILANFGLFRRQKNRFWFVYNIFLLPFHNKHILSCKKMQKKISLHIHFKLNLALLILMKLTSHFVLETCLVLTLFRPGFFLLFYDRGGIPPPPPHLPP